MEKLKTLKTFSDFVSECDTTYNVSYDKGTGKTKASNLSNKGGEIKLAEAVAINESTDLVKYWSDTVKKTERGGGNAMNFDMAKELANHIESYKHDAKIPPPGEPGYYSATTIELFTKLLDSMMKDEIEGNNADKY